MVLSLGGSLQQRESALKLITENNSLHNEKDAYVERIACYQKADSNYAKQIKYASLKKIWNESEFTINNSKFTIVVLFSLSDCGACLNKELNDLQKFKLYKKELLNIVLISVDKDINSGKKFINHYSPGYPVYCTEEIEYYNELKMGRNPMILFSDSNGVVLNAMKRNQYDETSAKTFYSNIDKVIKQTVN